MQLMWPGLALYPVLKPLRKTFYTIFRNSKMQNSQTRYEKTCYRSDFFTFRYKCIL